jgi:hypothetical protein
MLPPVQVSIGFAAKEGVKPLFSHIGVNRFIGGQVTSGSVVDNSEFRTNGHLFVVTTGS